MTRNLRRFSIQQNTTAGVFAEHSAERAMSSDNRAFGLDHRKGKYPNKPFITKGEPEAIASESRLVWLSALVF